MSEKFLPDFLKDATALLSADGFRTSNVWYHGTSSGLVEPILTHGLIGGGDTETKEREQQTLGTIGNRQFEANDPVYLTQSRELALFWAINKAHMRNLYFRQNEIPVVMQVSLDPSQVTGDVGAAALLYEPGNHYILTLKEIYEDAGIAWDDVDPMKADRNYYLHKLGMAYCKDTIPAEQLSVVLPG